MRIIILISIFSLSLVAYGNVNQKKVESLCGGSSLTVGSSISIYIQDYPCLTSSSSSCGFSVKGTKLYTRLSFGDELNKYYGNNWELDIEYEVDLYDQTGTIVNTKTGEHLKIDYSHTGNYKDIDYNLYMPMSGKIYYKSELRVTGITYTDLTSTSLPLSSLESDICLKLFLESELMYDGTSSQGSILHNPSTSYNTAKNELQLTWKYVPGAEYELEILPIDVGTSDLSSSSTRFDYDFKEAIRIHTNHNYYDLPMVFPSSLLLFRVRPVFYVETSTGEKKRIEGDFSTADQGTITGGNFSYTQYLGGSGSSIDAYKWESLSNPLSSETWQYSVSYAEDGKSAQSITFYDGLLYPVQSVTLSSSTKVAIVSQSTRDFIGRPAVNIMPSPVASTGIRFYPDIAKTSSSTDFNYLDFDLTGNYTNPNTLDAGSSVGSANYYSSSRTLTGGINTDYIPESGGHTYSRTIYSKDGTNRVIRQSGVGVKYKVGGGHETKYYYATPGQNELDVLFGNNSGLAKNYKKNMVVDPNGQASVSYIDGSGRTIATALRGSSANGNLDIDTKPDDSEFPVLNYNLNENNEVYDGTKVISTRTILIQSGGEKRFNYEVDSSLYSNCIGSLCEYELTIYIFDIENEVKVPLAIVTSQGMGTLSSSGGSIKALLSSNEESSLTFSTTLPVGTYKVVKELKVPDSRLNSLYDTYLELNDPEKASQLCYNLCIPTISSCEDCKSNCEWKYIEIEDTVIDYKPVSKKVYYNNSGNAIAYKLYDGGVCDWASAVYYYVGYGLADYNQILQEISACETGCDEEDNEEISACKSTFEELKSDLSPEGQYFDNLRNDSTQTINTWLIQNIGSTVPASFLNGYVKQGQIPSGTSSITWDTIRKYWQEEWSEGLVSYHPEYCAFTQYCCVSTYQDNEVVFSNYSYASTHPTVYIVNDWQIDEDNGACYALNLSDSMSYYLTHFLLKDESDPSLGYYSLLEVANKQMATTHPKYDFFHGATGVVTNLTAPVFIQQFADAMTQKSKYDLASTHCNTSPNVFPLLGTTGNTRETPDGFFIHYPYIDWYINLAQFEQDHCEVRCESEIDRWIGEFKCQSAIVSGGDLDTLRSVLEAYCKSSECGLSTNLSFTLAVESHSTTYVATSFSQILSIFRTAYGLSPDLCPDPDLNTDVEREDRECGCEMVLYTAQEREGVERHMLPTTYSGLSGNWETDLHISTGESSSSNISHAYNHCVSDINFLHTSPTFLPSIFDCSEESDDSENPDRCEVEISSKNKLLRDRAIAEYRIFIKARAREWVEEYRSHCIANVLSSERFNYRDTLKEYHYTLYYYDQAGNLVGTVSPEGVYQKKHGFSVVKNLIPDTSTIRKHREGDVSSQFINATYSMSTNYKYNSLNQLTEQTTPDGGTSVFFYDALNRLIVSQNAEQSTRKAYSYTVYDGLGRIREVGEIANSSTGMSKTIAEDATGFGQGYDPSVVYTGTNPYFQWLDANKSNKHQIVTTYYDEAPNFYSYTGQTLKHLRNRISAVAYWNSQSQINLGTPSSATYYSYDYLGNVNTLIQENKSIVIASEQFKRIDYEYDLISGNVNKVSYQHGQQDQFYHRYEYDADNRLTCTYTSRDEILWDKESKNLYYLHGPLARTELGDKQVQAQDYAYTLQGWLKTVNSSTGNEKNDIGQDSKQGLNSHFARDAMGYSLHYYSGDYQSTGTGALSGTIIDEGNGGFSYSSTNVVEQFNGNISKMVVGLTDEKEKRVQVIGNTYRYDQLNRIKKYTPYLTKNSENDTIYAQNTMSPTGSIVHSRYQSDYSYDGNGNIKTLTRNGSQETSAGSKIYSSSNMDRFTYSYVPGSVTSSDGLHAYSCNTDNKLDHVADVYGNVTGVDLDNQSAGNYSYDTIGRLTSDVKENIDHIKWNVANKITKIIKDGGNQVIKFRYDPMGNRISKTDSIASGEKTTFYVRDAQGNVMATYEENMRHSTPTYKLNDFHIYGSSRLGVRQEDLSITSTGSSTLDLTYRELGNKRYELTNHLGNVLEVISDRKLAKEEVTHHAKFNGSGQYINLGTGSRGIVNEVTVEFMMKTTTNSSAGQAIVSDYGNPNVYGGYTVFLNQGKIEIRGRNSSDGIFKISGSNGTISVADGQWHHIAAVITPSDVWEVYIDGVLSESVNYGSTVNDLTNGVNLTIGRHYYNGLNYSGELKEVSIWNRAKSQLEIQQDRTSYFIGNETNLVSYLKLDEPTGGYQDKVTGGYYNNSPRPTSIAEGSVYYTADVISYSDYYPFGMLMPNRHGQSDDYRYGFNGHEKDDEVHGKKGSSYDFGARMYDSRIGRFNSGDPWEDKYAWQSSYVYYRNSPISIIDWKGFGGGNPDEFLDDGGPPEITGKEKDGQESKDGLWVFMKAGDNPSSESKWAPVPNEAELDAIKAGINQGIATAKAKGAFVAAANLQRFMNGTSGTKIESLEWLQKSSAFNSATSENENRFYSTLNSNGESLKTLAEGLKDGESVTFDDYWEKTFYPSLVFGNETDKELMYAWGASTIKSTGTFTLTKAGDVVTITGSVVHHWHDVYNWEPGMDIDIPGAGNVKDVQLKYMEFYRGAKPFNGSATWTKTVSGNITLGTFYNDNNIEFKKL